MTNKPELKCQNCNKPAILTNDIYECLYGYCSPECQKQHEWELEQYHFYMLYGVEQ